MSDSDTVFRTDCIPNWNIWVYTQTQAISSQFRFYVEAECYLFKKIENIHQFKSKNELKFWKPGFKRTLNLFFTPFRSKGENIVYCNNCWIFCLYFSCSFCMQLHYACYLNFTTFSRIKGHSNLNTSIMGTRHAVRTKGGQPCLPFFFKSYF